MILFCVVAVQDGTYVVAAPTRSSDRVQSRNYGSDFTANYSKVGTPDRVSLRRRTMAAVGDSFVGGLDTWANRRESGSRFLEAQGH